MSHYYIKTAFSAVLVILTFLVIVFTLTKQETFLELRKDYPCYKATQNNICVNKSKYYSKTVQTPMHRICSYTRNIIEENMKNISTLQVEVTDKLLPIYSDGKHLNASSHSFVQTRPLNLMKDPSILAPVKVNITDAVPAELRKLRPTILNNFPSKFLPSYKNPCYIRYPGEQLHCLPYFFLLGTPKSGTTDIWSKIVAHPKIVAAVKEPHWWTRKYRSLPLIDYEEKFMTKNIKKKLTDAGIKNKRFIVTGDGSASTFWDNLGWQNVYPEYKMTGPPYILADVIHTVLPDAKLLVSFRDPTTRLYSDYIFFSKAGTISPEDFHERVVIEINKFSSCLAERSLEACAYSREFRGVRLTVGLYSLYLRDWLRRYPRDQLMALKLEEWHVHCTQILPEIFKFLKVASLSKTRIADICKESTQNVNPKKIRMKPMLNSTRKMLRDFYRPFVVRLASILNDDKFLWDYDESHSSDSAMENL